VILSCTWTIEALKHLNSQDKLLSRHAKWAAYVQQFSFTIKHKAKALNRVADTLSRKLTLLVIVKNEVLGFDFIKELLHTNSFFGPIVEKVSMGARSDYGVYN
jgi:hypothetical protein